MRLSQLSVRIRGTGRGAIGSHPDTAVTAGPQGVADALRILTEGGEINYEGAAGSIDWDENGDLRRSHIGIWRFTRRRTDRRRGSGSVRAMKG